MEPNLPDLNELVRSFAEKVDEIEIAPDFNSAEAIAAMERDMAAMTVRRRADEVRLAAAELKRRRLESLRLYEPLPLQDKFHQSVARQRVIRGSNRSGKTLAAAVEVARAVTGQDPHKKYPTKDGRCYMVGLDLTFVSQVFYRKLFRPGAFRIIRDLVTGEWRAFRPWDAEDAARKKESKPAPPLIPQRFLACPIAWEVKGQSIPKMAKFVTGWEINFFSSRSAPPQGMDLDLVWFSEEIENDEWYPEMAARLLDRSGSFIWDATPQAGTDKLLELSEMADRERGKPEPIIEEFVALLNENPHIDDSEKRLLAELLDEDQYKVRVGGEFAIHGLRIFPEFGAATHVRQIDGVPSNWTRYMAVDPGRQVCAVLFGAVPPPGSEPFNIVLYRELYLKNASAETFGAEVAKATRGEEIESAIIDHSMGRQTEIGSGYTVEEQYSRALKRHKWRSRRNGHGFAWGTADVAGGIEMVREALAEGEEGCPKLVVAKGTCANFVEEIKRYKYKRQGRTVTDIPETRGPVHLMACLRYLVGHRPRHRPPTSAIKGSEAYQEFLRRRNRRIEAQGGSVVHFAPGR